MSPELWSAAAFAIAAIVTFAATPLTIRIAERTAFFDLPVGYKEHVRPTPYLGGIAIMAGIVAAVLLVPGVVGEHGVIVACALVLCAVGTLDDRVNLPVSTRLSVEASLALLLWSTGHGWDAFHSAPADLALT